MELRIRYGILIAIFLLSSAYASGDRAAMVVETKGNNTLTLKGDPVRMRTLQVLGSGAKVTVPEGAVLRLSYFKSGTKEKIIGPCTLEIQLESSKKTAGSGKVELQARRKAGTDLDKSNNLRRMGGALQANSTATPDSELKKLNEVAYLETPQTVRPPKPITAPRPTRSHPVVGSVVNSTAGTSPSPQTEAQDAGPAGKTQATKVALPSESKQVKADPEFIGRNQAYLEPKLAATVEWSPKKGGTITLFRHGNKILSSAVTQAKFQLPLEHLKPGSAYRLMLSQDRKSSSQEFRIFSQAEKSAYEELIGNIRKRESDDRQGLLSQLIYTNQDLGLLLEAEKAAKAAVSEYPRNSGFWMALGQIQVTLNKREEARAAFKKAQEVESPQ